MVWLTALANIFGFFGKLITFLHERNLKNAGAAEEKLKNAEVINELEKEANIIRNSELDDDLLLPPSKRNKRGL